MLATEPASSSNKLSVFTDTEPADIAPQRSKSFNPQGRPNQAKRYARLADEGQAFEIIKDKWTLISDTLADEALKAARSRKKDGKSLVATCTAAGIAYDKRWSKQVSDNVEISIPSTLASQIAAKLTSDTQANQQLTAKVAVLGQDCDQPDAATDSAAEVEAGG